jgi:hypothetical protein
MQRFNQSVRQRRVQSVPTGSKFVIDFSAKLGATRIFEIPSTRINLIDGDKPILVVTSEAYSDEFVTLEMEFLQQPYTIPRLKPGDCHTFLTWPKDRVVNSTPITRALIHEMQRVVAKEYGYAIDPGQPRKPTSLWTKILRLFSRK